MHLENTIKREEEIKVEKETATLTSFIDNRCMQTGSSSEHGSSSKQLKEPTLQFHVVKNGTAGTHVHQHTHTHTHQTDSILQPVLIFLFIWIEIKI